MQDPRSIPGIDLEMAAAMLKARELTPEGRLDVATAPIEAVRAQYLAGRAYWNEDGPILPRVRDHLVDGPHGPVPVRFYCPRRGATLPLLLYFHGGGFVYGSIASHDKICRWLADGSGAAVISVDYRLAPEFKFPTPLDEAVAVLDWAIANAGELRIDPERVGLGGDSAGASISLGTALTLREAGRPDAIKFLLLFYGSYGLGYDTESSRKFGSEFFGLPEARRRFYRSCYVADEADHADPRLNQLSADLSGLPPAFIGAAEMDPLCDNSPALSKALRAAGVATELRIYPGVLHGFLHMTRMVTLARVALDDAADAIRRGLA